MLAAPALLSALEEIVAIWDKSQFGGPIAERARKEGRKIMEPLWSIEDWAVEYEKQRTSNAELIQALTMTQKMLKGITQSYPGILTDVVGAGGKGFFTDLDDILANARKLNA